MTLDDLRLVFNTARVDGEDGIRAVVEALRDELPRALSEVARQECCGTGVYNGGPLECCGIPNLMVTTDQVHDSINEILASDGVERHPTTGNPVGTDTVAGRHPAADPAAYHGAVPQVPNGAYREMTVGYTPAALAEAGLVIVPRVPTEKMLAAAHDGPLGAAGEVMGVEQATWLAEMYRAMIGAEMTTDAQIKRMVEKFLCWELPIDFNPDNGITFDPIGSRGTPYEFRRQPVGTNLLTAQQAEAMIRHILAEAANEQ